MELQEIIFNAFRFIVKGVAVAGSFHAGRFLAGNCKIQWRNYLVVLVLAVVVGVLAGGMLRSHTGEIGPVFFKVSRTNEERIEYGAEIFLALGLPAAFGLFCGKPGRDLLDALRRLFK